MDKQTERYYFEWIVSVFKYFLMEQRLFFARKKVFKNEQWFKTKKIILLTWSQFVFELTTDMLRTQKQI